jgi:hypothetical protein
VQRNDALSGENLIMLEPLFKEVVKSSEVIVGDVGESGFFVSISK